MRETLFTIYIITAVPSPQGENTSLLEIETAIMQLKNTASEVNNRTAGIPIIHYKDENSIVSSPEQQWAKKILSHLQSQNIPVKEHIITPSLYDNVEETLAVWFNAVILSSLRFAIVVMSTPWVCTSNPIILTGIKNDDKTITMTAVTKNTT